MRKMKYIIGILLLFMVIGFATVTVSLSISGNVKVVSDVDDFKVYFSDAKLNGTSTPALIESATSLSFDVDFGNLGTQHVIEYDVTNASKLFDAVISMSCTQSNEYLSVVNEFDTSNLSALSTRTGTLTLTKTKSNASETNTDYAITCEIVASPVERDSEAIGDIPNSIDQKYAILKAVTETVSGRVRELSEFRSSTYNTKIKTITFEDKINVPETIVDSWDMSEFQNGKIMAYLVTNEEDTAYYDLYIQSNDKMYANKDMSKWFKNLKNVESINGLNYLDTSTATNMSEMFYYTGYSSTTFTLDLGEKFDTSNVTNMSNMFNSTGYSSTTFTLDLGEKFDTSNVTNMSYMFYYTGYKSTTFTLDLGEKFDTSNVTNMSYMFYYTGYSSPTFTLDLGEKFDTSNVTNMSNMFNSTGYSSPTFTLDLGDKFDTSNVTNMSNMFNSTGYSSPTFTLDLGDKFDTSKVVDMNNMFNSTGYSSPTFTLDLGDKFDTSKVLNIFDMFSYTGYSSTNLNISITIKNSKIATYTGMFTGVATKTGSKITVNYTTETSDLVDLMIATKSSTSNVVKGYNESSVISFTIDGATYNAYEGMTWGQWVDSEYNTDLEFNIITFGASDKLVPAPTDYYEPGVALHYGPVPQSTETVIQHGYAYTLGCD